MERKKVWLHGIRQGAFIAVILSGRGGACEERPTLPTSAERTKISSCPATPIDSQLRTLPTWKAWCDQEQHEPESEMPFCAMYLVKSLDEPLVEMFGENLDMEMPEDWSRFSEILEGRQVKWKRIGLVFAVWADGRFLRPCKLADGENSFEVGRLQEEQVARLMGSIEWLDLFRQPLSETRQFYVDVRYWVVEVNYGTLKLHMASWTQHPDLKDGNFDFGRFCDVWRCVVAWIEPFKYAESQYHRDVQQVRMVYRRGRICSRRFRGHDTNIGKLGRTKERSATGVRESAGHNR
jgi:hypothetical protein